MHAQNLPLVYIHTNDDNINNNKKIFFIIPYVKPISDIILSIFHKSDTIAGFLSFKHNIMFEHT